MAAIDHSAYAPKPAYRGFANTVSGALAPIRRAVRRHLAYRQTLGALRALDDRQLADIGLEGADLDVVARRMTLRIPV